MRRSRDWLNQAFRDLEFAKKALRDGYYEWACFSAHQAAEKATKALHQALGMDIRGHSIGALLAKLPKEYRPDEDLIKMARKLDRFYLATRYPNMLPSGAPYEYYYEDDAIRAIKFAEQIIQFCRDKIKEIEGNPLSFTKSKSCGLDRDKIIKQIAESIRNMEGVLCAILFGSLAAGEYTDSSDADILMIIKNSISQDKRYEHYHRILADIEVQPFIFTLDEIVSRIENGDTFVIEMIVTGIPIVGEGLFKHLKELCKKSIERHKLKRTKVGWVQIRDP